MENAPIHDEQMPKRKKTFRARGSRGGARKKRENELLVNRKNNLSFCMYYSDNHDGRYELLRNEKHYEKYQKRSQYIHYDEIKENDLGGQYNPKDEAPSDYSRFMKDDGLKTSAFLHDLNHYHQSQNDCASNTLELHMPMTSNIFFHEKINITNINENKSTNLNLLASPTILSQFLYLHDGNGGTYQSSGKALCDDDFIESECSNQSFFMTSPRSFLLGKRKARNDTIDGPNQQNV